MEPSCRLLESCKDAYDLVQSFQNDTQPWGSISKRRPGYEYDAELRREVKVKIIESLSVIETALERHGLKEIAISYNGGKDCQVMLLLILASIYKKYQQGGESLVGATLLDPKYKLDAIYINSEVPFPGVSTFIEESTSQYGLNPVTIKASLKEGFETYLSANPDVKAIVVGIRHSDPFGSTLRFEQETDGDWPRFLRIHPILHWDYVHIWDFLIGCDLDYCQVYDLGYTSLGGKNNTSPNPYLRKKDDPSSYLPAYMLKEDADNRERMGRNKKQ